METAELNLSLRQLAVEYTEAVKRLWGESLVSLILFGSVARGEASLESDIDLLLIATDLPPGRLARQDRLMAADDLLAPRKVRYWELKPDSVPGQVFEL